MAQEMLVASHMLRRQRLWLTRGSKQILAVGRLSKRVSYPYGPRIETGVGIYVSAHGRVVDRFSSFRFSNLWTIDLVLVSSHCSNRKLNTHFAILRDDTKLSRF